MPKRTLYTCDRCGKEYFDPEFFTDGDIAELAYEVHHINKDGNEVKYRATKDKMSSSRTYFCPDCAKEFNQLLKSFGIKVLHSTGILDDSVLKL